MKPKIDIGNNNTGTQWNYGHKVIYINKLIINPGPSGYDVNYTPSIMQRIKAALGIGPSKQEIETWARQNILGEGKNSD